MAGVRVVFDDKPVLDRVDWTVEGDQRWVVLGPNGSGKTTLMRLASLYLHPTAGTIEVMGQRLGRTDVRLLRQRIGLVSAGFSEMLRPGVRTVDVVMTGRHAALEAWWHDYDSDDRARARELLGRFEVAHVADHAFGTLSSGERQRVLLARALANDPGVLLLDEPMAGLDLGGREVLVDTLSRLARDRSAPPYVLVTHHVEEVPADTTHALLVGGPAGVVGGPVESLVTSEGLSACFGLDIDVRRDPVSGRFRAVAS